MAWLPYAATAALLLTPAPFTWAQVPPPPMPSADTGIAQRLIHAFAAKDADAYAALLADDVQVFEDGRSVAQNKAAWLKTFTPKLLATGVSFKLAPGYASAGRVLFIEYFNSLASWGRTPPADCCWAYDAVAYDVVAGKITVIRRLRGGTFRLDGNGDIAGN